MLRTDVVENGRDCSSNAVVEALHAVGVNRSAGKFVSGMPNRIVGGKLLADGPESLPFIGHEAGVLMKLASYRQVAAFSVFGWTRNSRATSEAG